MGAVPITSRQFAVFVAQAADGLCQEWDEAHAGEPESYPDRLTLAEWWEYFSEVVIPDLMGDADPDAPALQVGRTSAALYQI